MTRAARCLALLFTLSCGLPGAAVAADETAAIGQREPLRHLTEAYARFRKAQISNPAYQLRVELDTASDRFRGEVQIDFELAAGNTAPVTVDFDNGSVLALEVNGRAVESDYTQWFISIPAAALQPGSNQVNIRYERPYASDGAGLHRFIDPENGEIYLYTNFEPYDANRWFPHFDQPNLKAALTLEVSAPADWEVIANTRESSVTASEGRRHWLFPATPPISSYIYAMHAGPFRVWEASAGDIPLRLFARNAVADYVDTAEWFEPTRKSFDFFQRYFDIPYPFGKYDQVIVPDFNAGAMENVAAVTFSERYLSRGVRSTAQKRSLASVIAHEMAHMWFGDLVTMDWWDGLWLNESFATYMANLALEASGDFENVWDSFYTGTKLWAYDTDELVTTHPIQLEVPTTADAFTNFDGITYGKGGSVLKQLPYFIGAENFRQGVSSYLKQHSWGNTRLEDFVNALAEASGQDLTQWQQEWLYSSGLNTVQADFRCENGQVSTLRLLQEVPGVGSADKMLRSQRTQVGLYRYTDGAMVTAAVIPVTYSGAVTWVTEAIGQPCPDLVLPNEADWAYLKIKLDPVSLDTARTRINSIAQPATRLMLWQSLWDSARSGDLALTSYVDFVLQNAATELDDNVLRHLTSTLGSAFSYLSVFGGHGQLQARIEAFLRTQTQAAAPGTDAQKVWFDSLLARSFTLEGLDYLLALLDGREQLEGLPLDQDRRWLVLRALNRYQHGDYLQRLEAEKQRDPSDQGVNMALAAEAIRPDPAIKQQWLSVLLEAPDTYKLATLRTVMAVLYPAEQGALADADAARILAAVPELNRSASQEFLGEFTGYLSTASCSEASVARLNQANRDFAGMQPLVVKSFLIHQQEDARCLRMRQTQQ
jgi:aminopeptidase N